MIKVAFYRHFKGFRGGHLKVWDYFNHFLNAPGYFPQIYFSKDSVWDEQNPWLPLRDSPHVTDTWQPDQADLLFLGGMDWMMFERPPSRPVINLIQHVKHAKPGSRLNSFLRHRAVRICVSPEVGAALRATRQVNGPIFVIPNGIDFRELPPECPWAERDWHVLIVALKQPELGQLILPKLERPGRIVTLLTNPLPRREFLECISRTKVTVFLPNPLEGFYLPALEGMALGTLVVCPDCKANGFCVPGVNCFRPAHEAGAILAAAEAALALDEPAREALRAGGRERARQHELLKEREAFHGILAQLDRLW